MQLQRTWNRDTVGKIGERVRLNGWAARIRAMGEKLVFIDLRDRSGLVQLVCYRPDLDADMWKNVEAVRSEFVLEIVGEVKMRSAKQVNPEMATGTVEIAVKSLTILNPSQTPPFPIDGDTRQVNEELRLKYRYLDLRSERLAANMTLRHHITSLIRSSLNRQDFREIETPHLGKGTPEGAREFIVPSRNKPGAFYTLPQSPQQYKQLLMVAGIERYYQIARCFRDEDQRGDRQPEFTQLDMELSFVDREDVMALNEALLMEIVEAVSPEKKIQKTPFPRLTYREAMETYGTDRPDLRNDKTDPNELAFCWVVDFPFFEPSETGGWTFTHNPFSAPKEEHIAWLMRKERIGEILTTQYDVVLNGFEIGGGSIRNHQPDALRSVLEIMGADTGIIDEKFGHILEAFRFGAPPHGGIAWGLDRLVAILANEANIREVIAFPKMGDASDPLMGAPSPLPEKALKDVHIKSLSD